MADNYGYQEGTDGYARAKEVGTQGGKPLVVPLVSALTTIPKVLGFKKQSVTTAASLSTIATGATHALVTVDLGGGQLRFREDASNPTTTEGLLILEGSAVELTNLSDVRVVSTEGTCIINITYRKYSE